MPNLPIVYWQQNKKKKVPKNSTGCTKFPDIYDIHFNNKYWQVLESSNGSFYLYGAYLDVRANNRLGPTVRVLGMINRLEPSVKTQCQLWFSEDKPGSEPVVSRVLEYKYIWDKQWGNYKQGREWEGGWQSQELPTIISLLCHQRKILMSAAFRFSECILFDTFNI